MRTPCLLRSAVIDRRSSFGCRVASLGRGGTFALTASVALIAALLAPLARAAEVTHRMLLLDGALVGNAIVAVGERGTIIRSTSNARSWESATVPTRATLTGISFATEAAGAPGWAVGHEGVIFASTDEGRTWTKQFQSENIQDSFLDVLALDATHVLALGAYGLCVASDDAGKTWTRRKLIAEDNHLNRITRGPTGALYIAGERGTLLRSRDQGATWTALASPSQGSFYGVLPLDRTRLLAHGLSGQMFRSVDDGASWERVTLPAAVLVAASLKMRSNYLVIGGQARGLMISRDFGRTFQSFPELTTAVAELLELSDGTVLALGEDGAVTMSVTPR